MDKFRKQLNKGVLELSVLKLLNEEDQYGYSILQEISTRTKERITIKDGTLYPILYRLEDQQFIESYWKTDIERSKKPRKYYRITDLGKKRFEEMLRDYLEVTSGMKNILNT